ncbi:hypothetical protein B0H66DRAFT_639536 [Apodospora peruviana]|uniref:Heterokaryon incompatibility domain-containing protein n=1 Tax=Apodospora peruviana TaxID=516989 RepID=A0AAE0M3Q5_9PEZI|nr:hypothetical protein B0H66DRAFT_639536 [Apodospora peruviana]
MCLINARTLELEAPRFGSDMPSYAILSHAWETDEVTLQETCALAQSFRLDHVWVDTCMPLLYGESEKAFTRLQHKMIKTSSDLSIFGWHSDEKFGTVGYAGLTASLMVTIRYLITSYTGSLQQLRANFPRKFYLNEWIRTSSTEYGARISASALVADSLRWVGFLIPRFLVIGRTLS